MRRIAHISDLHFGSEDASVVAGLGRDIAACRADVVLVSGDLSQRARPREFAKAAAFLGSLGRPALAVPGNHDIPLFNLARRLFAPFDTYRALVSPDLSPTYADHELSVFGLNTVLPYAWKGGLVRGTQLHALRAWAAAAGSRLRVVFAHHPFSRAEASGHALVRGWAPAVAAMEEAGVDLLLTGHHHVAGHSESRSFAVAGPHRLVVVRAGTAASRRLRTSRNSYNLIHVDRTSLGVEERVWDGKEFVAGARMSYPRAEGAGRVGPL